MLRTNKQIIIVEKHQEPSFFDDMTDLFFGMNDGHLGKYCYDGNKWGNVLVDSTDYYIPRADNELIISASSEINAYLPRGIPYLDFGVGCAKAFVEHVLPVMNGLNSRHYVGVDFCRDVLLEISTLKRFLGKNGLITTVQGDIFHPIFPPPTQQVSLGVMNGLTLTNMYGRLSETNVMENLVHTLRHLSSMTQQGWLLLTIDTNRDESSLLKAYKTQATSSLYLNVFHRAYREIDTRNFDPTLFAYDPEWIPESHLFAHCVVALEEQQFQMGSYDINVHKGQKFHVLNSYKFTQAFFESCCNQAGLDVLKVWHHETPMKLYLLKDRANPIKV